MIALLMVYLQMVQTMESRLKKEYTMGYKYYKELSAAILNSDDETQYSALCTGAEPLGSGVGPVKILKINKTLKIKTICDV